MRAEKRMVDRLRRPSRLRKVASLLATGALVASGLTLATTALVAPAAQAEESVPGVPSGFDTTFFAYVQAGETLDVDFTKAFTNADGDYSFTVTDPAGTEVFTCSLLAADAVGESCAIADLSGPAGVWTITQAQTTQAGGSSFDWNITVSDGAGVAQTGRVWTDNYGAYQTDGVQTRDLSYTVLNDTGYRYAVNLYNYNGIGSRIIANSLGLTGPDGQPLYESGVASGINPDFEGPQYRIFFDEPSAVLPAAAPSAQGEISVAPPLLTDAELAVDDLAFTPTLANSGSGTFSYSINERFSGAYNLQVDTNGNGSYDDAVDRTITLGADGTGEYTYDFDGLDGEGNVVADCTLMNARIFFEKLGEIHLLQIDVEGRTGGIEIVRLNGTGAPDDTVYWNDTTLTGDRANSTPVLDGTAGIASTGGVHGWANNGNSWGNNRTIDDWAFDPIALDAGEIQIGGRCLDVEKTSDATADTRVGDTVTYTVSATNTGVLDYTDETPATFTDDLTGVLDDATYNEDAAVDVEGDVTYTEPKLSWTGALPAGDTVTLTYTTTLTATGDGVVRNVAYGDTPDVPTPTCDPPDADGTDPATGIACAENVFELPRLTITKAASETELPAVGTEVTYTVTATNAGPGDFTADAPASLTDDLTEVLDDATFNDDATSTIDGTLDYVEPELTWEGALAADESVTVEYTVTYTGEGDQLLTNTACVPADDAVPGTDPCAEVSVPGAALNEWKTVEASDSPLGEGDTLTYTLNFESTGTSAAAVDAVDSLVHVLDDADVTVEPVSTGGVSAVRTGDSIAITGSVEPGTTATVTYTVTLRSDAERGDNIAANFLLAPDEVPPTDPVCVPTDDEFPDCTVNLIPEIVDAKSVDPDSGATVEPGQELTYTLTFENIGEGAGTVDRVDDLTHILDDAEVTVAPTASDDALTVSEIADGRFSITGELDAGQTVTVTYTVTVNAMDELGDTELGNFLLDPTDPTPETPGECEPGSEDCTYNPVPRMEDSKSVTPESGTAVVPGEELTYTLTFENTSTVPAAVDRVDDLTHILDDAEVTVAPTASDAALTVSDVADGRFSITGELAAGQTVTVTYTVIVNANDDLGDAELDNFLLEPTDPTPETPGECEPGSEDCTYNPAPLMVDTKSVDPASGTPVVADQELTYTLTFRNEGAAAGELEKVDDLTHVLDDADVIVEPTASDDALTVTRDGARISITGALEAGQEVTVTYTVAVRASEERGDDILANFLLAPDQTPPTDPGECTPGEGELPDCTTNPVGDIVPAKSVNPENGSTVESGNELTYTLSFENVGAGSAVIDYTDYMEGVLDDAELVGAAQATDGLTVTGPDDGQLRVTGTLEAGQSGSVTYTVRVLAYDQQGDHQLANFLTPAGQEPPTECLDTNPLCTQNPIDPPAPGLAVTGGEIAAWVLITGLALLVGGGVLLMVRRRRESGVEIESIN